MGEWSDGSGVMGEWSGGESVVRQKIQLHPIIDARSSRRYCDCFYWTMAPFNARCVLKV